MPEGSPLREAFKKLIAETITELSKTPDASIPESGVVTAVNLDGTVNVQTASGVYNTGAAVQFTIGALVVVITGDGKRVSVPR